ncbi:hypothetical protein J3R30DRAFT_3406774 [Lentinula aciculospora]|uniref:Uncharacterized protein n=1 Tax=Lentinula aciculospora TaxID=153920 RepID=A0A9W9A2J7_9AGAR|nr:hypothetical protein J3R30DRAFT_3406774 [Lentinula aciculospora]
MNRRNEAAFEEELVRLEEEAAHEAEREAEEKKLEEEKRVVKKREEEWLIEESITKAKANALKKMAEEESARYRCRAEALQELQEHQDCAARAASCHTSDQVLQEPSGSKSQVYKSASMVHNTLEVEVRVLKRKQVVPQVNWCGS